MDEFQSLFVKNLAFLKLKYGIFLIVLTECIKKLHLILEFANLYGFMIFNLLFTNHEYDIIVNTILGLLYERIYKRSNQEILRN